MTSKKLIVSWRCNFTLTAILITRKRKQNSKKLLKRLKFYSMRISVSATISLVMPVLMAWAAEAAVLVAVASKTLAILVTSSAISLVNLWVAVVAAVADAEVLDAQVTISKCHLM